MEKIITVKQEPIDDAYTTPPSTTTASVTTATTTATATAATRNVTTKTTTVATLASGTLPSVAVAAPAASEPQIFFIQPKAELQKTPCTVAAVVQGATGTTSIARTVAAAGQAKPLVVISGSPIKLTPLSRAGSVLAGAQTNSGTGGNITCTLVHVQPFNAAAKQNIAPKAGGSPSKQAVPVQLQKIVPINVTATTLAKLQSGTTPQFTIAAPPGPATSVRYIAPKVNIVQAAPSGQAVQITPSIQIRNIAPAEKPPQIPQQLAPKPPQTQASGAAQQPRLIVPALPSNLSQIAGAGATGNIQFPHGVISGGVVYLPQQALASGSFPIAVPLQANALNTGAQQGMSVNGSSPESSPPNRPRKPCNCTKSQCLKLYCDCFANGEFCSNCNCVNCSNNMEHEKERSKAIKACLERNPQAFHPKIGKGRGDADRRHNKGCHCKRSGCLKNYCECYEAKILCTNLCKCTGCKNFEESPERKTLMHLADAAEVRVNQQNAARTKLESQIEDLPSRPTFLTNSGERLPFSFITDDVAQATCQCLLAQAADAESEGKTQAMIEKMVLEEFGRCLLSIIHTANGTKE